jgi:hypothetical protein
VDIRIFIMPAITGDFVLLGSHIPRGKAASAERLTPLTVLRSADCFNEMTGAPGQDFGSEGRYSQGSS